MAARRLEMRVEAHAAEGMMLLMLVGTARLRQIALAPMGKARAMREAWLAENEDAL